MRVGFVGWRGMVGSVLMQRMLAERDFDRIEPTFFSTSSAGGKGPDVGKPGKPLESAANLAALAAHDVHRHLPGRRLHQRRLPEAPGHRMDRLLDRRRLRASHGRRRHHHPRPGQPERDRRGPRARCQELHRRQLHGQPDDDGARGPVPARSRRVDDVHDLSGGLGRGRAEHARAPPADGRSACRREGAARRSRLGNPRHRPRGRRHPARRALPDRALRSSPRRKPDPVDRQGSRRRPLPAKSGRAAPRPTRSSAARSAQFRSTRSACASAPCAATRRR